MEDEIHQDGPIELDELAPGVAFEENMRLSLGYIIDIQQFLGLIAERLGEDAIQAIKAEENDHARYEHKQDCPARNVNLPRFMAEERFDLLGGR